MHGKELAGFIGKDAVAAIAKVREADVLPDVDVAIVQLARQIAKDATKVTSGQIEVLKYRHDLTDAEVFDIVAIAAGRSFLTKLLDGLGVAPDNPWNALDPDFRERLNIGRPIDLSPPDHVQTEDAA